MNNYGSGVSRVLDPTGRQFLDVIFQQGKPPCDSEFTLAQDMATEWWRQAVLSGTPSGFLGNETNPRADFVTSSSFSNFFQFGTQRAGETDSLTWAVVNGWLVPVTGTLTGTPPGSPNNSATYNIVALNPPPSNAGDFRIDFVYLEVWLARVPPNPSTLNKPASSAIYYLGNVQGGQSYLPDDLIDPAIGFETTERVQLQYCIRVASGLVGLTTNPDGFDPTVVKAQGASSAATSYVFQNMRAALGDSGLWRAGDGTQNALGTVDGYSYAIPISAVFRRNSVAWSGDPSQNLNGGFNRNPTAVDRTGFMTFTQAILAADLSTSATVATLTSAANLPLPVNPATPVLIQIGDELLTYTALTTGSPPQITGLLRAQNGTRADLHRAGTVVTLISGRPDGLFADQIALTDILDLRHAVNPNGFDYDALLKDNLDSLMRGQLRANWKRTGAGPQGPFCLYQDKITTGSVSLGVTKLDAFDGIRQVFSDAATLQRVDCICVANTGTLPASITSSVGYQTNISAVQPSLGLAGVIGQATSGQFSPGDTIQIPVAQLKTGLAAGDSDQVRWVYDGIATAVQLRIDGQSSNINPALYTVTGSTSVGSGINAVTSASGLIQVQTTTPHKLVTGQTVIITGVTGVSAANGTWVVTVVNNFQFTLNSSTFSGSYTSGGVIYGPNLTPSDDLYITLGPNFPNILNQGPPPGGAGSFQLVITLNIMYGPGRGLSRRPDSLHSVSFINPSTDLMVRPIGVPQSNQQTSVSWLPLWQKYRGGVYKNNVPTASEIFADLGSKSIVVAPYRSISMPTVLTTMDGTQANPYVTVPVSGMGSAQSASVFQDPSKNFLAAGIAYGDTLILTGGPLPGRYLITSVTATTLTTASTLPLPSGGSPQLAYSVEHVLGLVVGSNGQANNSTTLTDTSVNFSTAGVVAGDLLYIHGTYAGRYTVQSVAPTVLTVERSIFTGAGAATGLQYVVSHAQGLMPLNAANGTTTKWATTDPLGLFSGTSQSGGNSANTKNVYVTLPRDIAPGWGAFYVPILPVDESPFAQGINFMSLSIEGSTFVDGDRNYVPYSVSSGSFSFATFSTLEPGPPIVPAVYNATFGNPLLCGIQQFTDTRGLGRQGLQLPPFYGIARLFAVYEAHDYFTNGSAYNANTRAPGAGGATNLLRQNMGPADGPTFWVELDQDGDSTFILSANAIDITRSPIAIASFSAGNYVIESSIFGFDRGSFDITKEFRLVLTNPDGSNGGGSGKNRTQANANASGSRYTTSGTGPNVGAHIAGPTCVLPGPATQSDQLVVNYSRTPYQGDAWGSQTNYIDISQNVGPLQSGVAYQLVSNPLNQNALTRPNQKVFEILSSVGFTTTLGTGRISGDVSSDPVNARDVGFEDPMAYPPVSSVAPRPVTLTGTFKTDYLEVGTEYLGATERLPLGSLFRDADFRGGLFGNGTQAPLVYFDNTGVGNGATNLAVSTSLEQTEVLLDTSTAASGAPSNIIVQVDGEQNNYSLLVNYRTLRGGSLFTAGGAHPGGEVSAQQPSVLSLDGHTNVLQGRAFLVRNYTTSVGSNEVSPGGELMMLIMTNVERLVDGLQHPGFITIGTNGSGEGYAAADFYRIDGHPMVRDNVRVLINPETIALSKRSM